jgi:hypothetical protein
VPDDERFDHADAEQTGPIHLAPAQRDDEADPRAAIRDAQVEWLPSESEVLIRPYARTGGRTKPAHDLAIESLVLTCAAVERYRSLEQRMIASLCVRPRSVAEVAALLSIPLGVARVLLVDMATAGLVVVHGGAGNQAPDIALMRRVLAGLRRL